MGRLAGTSRDAAVPGGMEAAVAPRLEVCGVSGHKPIGMAPLPRPHLWVEDAERPISGVTDLLDAYPGAVRLAPTHTLSPVAGGNTCGQVIAARSPRASAGW
jgi:hypothetical protein